MNRICNRMTRNRVTNISDRIPRIIPENIIPQVYLLSGMSEPNFAKNPNAHRMRIVRRTCATWEFRISRSLRIPLSLPPPPKKMREETQFSRRAFFSIFNTRR